MECPQCKTGLVMAERQGVEIDHCPKCRGVWLDRGELDKIIERSNAYTATHPSERAGAAGGEVYGYSDDDDHARRSRGGGDYPRQKRKSFWTELFD